MFSESDVEVEENTSHKKCTIRTKKQRNDEKEKERNPSGEY